MKKAKSLTNQALRNLRYLVGVPPPKTNKKLLRGIKDLFPKYCGRKIKPKNTVEVLNFALSNLKYIFGEKFFDWRDPLLEFKREKRLKPKDINPLLIIRSPRDIKAVAECYNKMDFIDVLWIKYYSSKEALEISRKYVADHPEYTHIVLSSDDVYPSPFSIQLLLNDLLTWNFPVIAGCCNFCEVWNKQRNKQCPMCENLEEHPFINVTIDPVVYELGERRIEVSNVSGSYKWLTQQYRESHYWIERVWFQGLALGIIRRDIFMESACLPYINHRGKESYSDDFSLAVECEKRHIPQFCDFRAYMRHDSRYHNKLLVGKEKPTLTIIKAKRKLGDVIPDYHMVPLLVCTPFNNEEHAIPQFFQSLINLDYPKELMDIVWYENDSVDNTWKILKGYVQEAEKMGYHSVKLIRKDFGLKRFGKLSAEDFSNPNCANITAGKNYVRNTDDRIKRAHRLSLIYDYFFAQMVPEYHRYFLMFMADALAPSDAIIHFLNVFEKYSNAGWVGGVHHKRFPLEKDVAAPLMLYPNGDQMKYRYTTDAEIAKLQLEGNPVFVCGMTGHFFMIKEEVILAGARTAISDVEIIEPLVRAMRKLGYQVYCDSEVYLQHISLDGKIYRQGLIKPKPPELKEQDELNEFNAFRNTYLRRYYDIPPRPNFAGVTVIDPLIKDILDTEAWDKRFGRWKKYLI